ncbi:hypothetical protein OH77DRAFT_1197394 [Trametes cingulata]|nr:hypothetical protein OH77DRAFT_1197394 [Trametes cingulata]
MVLHLLSLVRRHRRDWRTDRSLIIHDNYRLCDRSRVGTCGHSAASLPRQSLRKSAENLSHLIVRGKPSLGVNADRLHILTFFRRGKRVLPGSTPWAKTLPNADLGLGRAQMPNSLADFRSSKLMDTPGTSAAKPHQRCHGVDNVVGHSSTGPRPMTERTPPIWSCGMIIRFEIKMLSGWMRTIGAK